MKQDKLTLETEILETDMRIDADGLARISLHGRLDAHAIADEWADLERFLHSVDIKEIEVDASDLSFCDSAGFALLGYLETGGLTAGVRVSIIGLEADLQKYLARFTTEDYELLHPKQKKKAHHLPEEVGFSMRKVAADFRIQVEFIGTIVACFPAAFLNPKRMRWHEVFRIFELAGANAVPIVSLLSALVGLIIAFECIQPLSEFGAQIYVANMIGLVMVRELGPLLAAILLAGRSGSAFAAEIGTMKVNEELNALETLGLDPIRFLVIQRITAGILLTPLLSFYATFMGVLGGVFVVLCMGFSLSLIFHQLASIVHLNDIAFNAIKAVVFGAIVSGIGCLRGLQTELGPSAVGVSTTRAVVSGILLIIITDAVFSVLYFVLQR